MPSAPLLELDNLSTHYVSAQGARVVRAVDRLMMAAGGRGIFLANPIQRAWRDVHAMQAHAGSNLERAAAVFGRSEFGLPPSDIRF